MTDLRYCWGDSDGCRDPKPASEFSLGSNMCKNCVAEEKRERKRKYWREYYKRVKADPELYAQLRARSLKSWHKCKVTEKSRAQQKRYKATRKAKYRKDSNFAQRCRDVNRKSWRKKHGIGERCTVTNKSGKPCGKWTRDPSVICQPHRAMFQRAAMREAA